jgi:hypothetical protein
MSSLEEDLRHQRMRQQQRQEAQREQIEEQVRQEHLQKLEHQQEQAREQELEEELRQRRPTPRQLIVKGLSRARVHESTVRLPAAFALGNVQETSCMFRENDRRKLRCLWHSKHLLDNMTINPRAFLFYGKKHKSLIRTLPDGLQCSWDLMGKKDGVDSMRTMDIAMLHTSSDLPMIASIVDGGWSLFNPYGSHAGIGQHDDNIQVNKCRPVSAIRCHESSRRVGMIRFHIQEPGSSEFLLYSLPSTGTMLKTLDLMISLESCPGDFCFGKDLVLFSSLRTNLYNEPVPPLFLPLGSGGGILRKLHVRNFPASDALRIEMACDDSDRYIVFGHRNGQASLIDLRASNTVSSIFHCEESESSPRAATPLGSVLDMCFVSEFDSKQLLVRRSHGSHQLHDLRMSTNNHRNDLSSSPSMMWNMAPPMEEIDPALTRRCNGFALDPIGKQTLISPYINANKDAVLGVWSLKTGLMVGSKLLKKSSGKDDVLYAEMCQRVTPSYATRGSRTKSISSSSTSWAAWLKCGAVTSDKTNLNVGSLHQVSFPGHWEY